jgi:hypothetical protein
MGVVAHEGLGEQGQRDPHGRGRNQQQEERGQKSKGIQHPGVIEQRPKPGRKPGSEDRKQIDEPDASERDGDFSDGIGAHRIYNAASVSGAHGVAQGQSAHEA